MRNNSKKNNMEKVVNRSPAVELYRFGLSTLNWWIRFSEYIPLVGYVLHINKCKFGKNEGNSNY